MKVGDKVRFKRYPDSKIYTIKEIDEQGWVNMETKLIPDKKGKIHPLRAFIKNTELEIIGEKK